MNKEAKPWQPCDPQQLCSKLADKCADLAREAGVKRVYSCYCSFKIPVDAKLMAVEKRSEAEENVNFEIFAATRDFSLQELQRLQQVRAARAAGGDEEDITARHELEILMRDVHNIFKLVAADCGFRPLFKYKAVKTRSRRKRTAPQPRAQTQAEYDLAHFASMLQTAAGEESAEQAPGACDEADLWAEEEYAAWEEAAAGEAVEDPPPRHGPVRRRVLLDEITLGSGERSCGYLLIAVSRDARPLTA